MPRCRVKGCGRTVFARGLCGFHALQGYYRAEAVRGVGLTAARVRRPPEMVVFDDLSGPRSGHRPGVRRQQGEGSGGSADGGGRHAPS